MSGATRSTPLPGSAGANGAEDAGAPPTEGSAKDGASATKAIKLNVVMSLALQVLNVVSGLELARGLGVTGRGELAAAILWPTVIGAIGTLGLQESMTYHVARDRSGAGRLLGSALSLWAIQSVIFSAITVAIVPLVLHKHSGAVITAGLIYTGYISLNMYGLVLVGTVNGLHRYGLYNAGIVSVGLSIVVLQTVLLATGDFKVKTIVIGMMACYVACMAFATWLTKRAHPGRLRVDRKTMRMLFGYGIRSNTSTASSFLNQRLDQLVISAFLTAHQLGIYVVAVTFTLFAPLLGGAIALAALPNVARLTEAGEQKLLARRMVSFTLIAAALVSLPIVILAPFLIKLFFGSAFSVGGNITRVTAVASVSFATTRSLEAVLRGIGRPLAAGMAEFVALGATAVFLAALLPTLGLIGAAWASLIAYSVSGAWMAWRIRTITGLPVRKLLTPDREGLLEAREKLRGLRKSKSGGPPDADHTAEQAAAALLDTLGEHVTDTPEAYFGGPLVLDALPGPGVASTSHVATPPMEAESVAAAPPLVPQAKAPEELLPAAHTMVALIRSDYDAEYPDGRESARMRSLLLLPRLLANPSLRAAALVRLQLGSPAPLDGLWRRLLVSLHSIEIGPQTQVGPGLRLPHPSAIRVARAVLGRDVVLENNVSIAPPSRAHAVIEVGDGVTVAAGTEIVSDLRAERSPGSRHGQARPCV